MQYYNSLYGFSYVLLYHVFGIIYYICITTTDECTHILDLDCVSKIGRDAKSLSDRECA